MTLKRLLTASGCVAALAAAGTASAQQIALEEIVVTARKTEERLQDVPLSVTAFTSAEIADRGLNDVYEVSNFTTSFTFERLNRYGVQGGASRPVIRGMSNILGEANAAIFIDGLLFSDSILSFPFDIVERVEVIKGPQAALFGRATFAGAINLITKKGTNDFENKISGRIAEYDDYEFNILSRGPLSEDKVFYMLHARYYDFGGMYRNLSDNQKVGNEQSYNLDGSLEFRPSENLSITISGGYLEDDDGAPANKLQESTENNCFLDVARQYYCGVVKKVDTVDLNLDLFGDLIGLRRESYRVTGQIEYDAGGFFISSNTGYFNSDIRNAGDNDLTNAVSPLGGTFNSISNQDREEWSTELRIQSPQDESFRYLAGAFYYQNRESSVSERLNGTATTNSGTQKIDNWAIFGAMTADFSDDLTGSVELRYARDKIANFNPFARVPPDETIGNTFKSWSPRFTMDYKVTEDSLVYATVAKGNKPGVINADPRFPEDIRFAEEESSWNYELGTKNTLMDGRLLINMAAYYIDWSKQQLTTNFFFPDGASQSYLINAGKSKVEGIEFEMNGVFNEYASGGFNYSINDATFVELDDPEAGQLFGDTNLRGKQTPNSSKHQFNIFSRFQYPVADGVEAYFRADFSYKEGKYAQVFNLANSGDQKLLNLKVGLEAEDWVLTLFVDNVTNNRVPSTVIRFVDFKNILPIGDSMRTSSFVRGFQTPPTRKRQFGLTASYNF